MIINANNVQLGWISGMPRSGTTWLSQIFASSPDVRLKFCPLFSYEFKNSLDENSTAEEWGKLFADVYQTKSEYLDQDYLRKQGLIPAFSEKQLSPANSIIKSTRFHNLIPRILKLNHQIRFLHIVRDPCATIYSWLTNPNEFPEQADPMSEWRTGSCRKSGPGEYWGFDDWKIVTEQALRLSESYPAQFKILRYEDLVQDTLGCIKDVFNYFDIPYLEQTSDFISLSHSLHDDNKRSVYKNPKQHEGWRNKLDPRIVSVCMDEITGTELDQFLST